MSNLSPRCPPPVHGQVLSSQLRTPAGTCEHSHNIHIEYILTHSRHTERLLRRAVRGLREREPARERELAAAPLLASRNREPAIIPDPDMHNWCPGTSGAVRANNATPSDGLVTTGVRACRLAIADTPITGWMVVCATRNNASERRRSSSSTESTQPGSAQLLLLIGAHRLRARRCRGTNELRHLRSHRQDVPVAHHGLWEPGQQASGVLRSEHPQACRDVGNLYRSASLDRGGSDSPCVSTRRVVEELKGKLPSQHCAHKAGRRLTVVGTERATKQHQAVRKDGDWDRGRLPAAFRCSTETVHAGRVAHSSIGLRESYSFAECRKSAQKAGRADVAWISFECARPWQHNTLRRQGCTELFFTLSKAVEMGDTLRRLPAEHAHPRSHDF
eukprot:scaffold8421_cov114-Isochrysis_galbana.AAC.7